MSDCQPIYANSYALVIGINDYTYPGFIPLGKAEKDAERMAVVLGSELYNYQITQLTGKAASRRAILRELSRLEHTDLDTRILFYFAGHGYTVADRYGHPTGFLAAHDTDPDDRFSAIRLSEVTEFTRHAEAKHISFIFDSCYSAAALGLIAPRDNVAADRYLTTRVYQALTAGEEVVDDAHSMTDDILEFLSRGEVDPETGLLTFRELADYVRDRMVARTRSIQKPVMGYLPGSEGGEYLFLMDTGPRLPPDLEMALRSENGYIRGGAVASLIDLARRDDLLADLAVAHLEEMVAADPDEQVRGAAQSYFDELEALRLDKEERARQEQLAHQAEEERARLVALEVQLEEARRKQAESESALQQAEEAEQRRLEAIEAARKAREIIPPGEFTRPAPPGAEPEQPTISTISAKPIQRPRPTPATKSIPWVWIGGFGVVVMIGIIGVIGLIALLENMGLESPATEEPTQIEAIVAEEETYEPIATPTDQPTLVPPTPTERPPAEPTRHPALVLAETGVSTNNDWEPYIQEFDGVKMALVPAGCFMMGSTEDQIDVAFNLCEVVLGEGKCERDWDSSEQPAHEVCFDEPFWIDMYEVTNKQYGLSGELTDEDFPSEGAIWSDALAYCESRGGRLPTEAEWEYAARGPDSLIFPWGNTFDGSLVNSCDKNCTLDWANKNVDDGYEKTAPVGSYLGGLSWIGAYDQSGNVWEWVSDWYGADYYASFPPTVTNPQGPDSGEFHVLRGGSWYANSDSVRAANRYWTNGPGGIRCVLSY